MADADERFRIIAELEAVTKAVMREDPEDAAACVRVAAPMIERWRSRAETRKRSERKAPGRRETGA